MKHATLLATLLLAAAAHAQDVHTFEFGPLNYGGNSAQFTKIDGENPNCGIGWCGSIQIPGQWNSYWGMEAPNGPCANGVCGWGFPNGGFLTNNTVSPKPGPLTFDTQACQTAYEQYGFSVETSGCTSYTDTVVQFIGYGAGVTVEAIPKYKVIPQYSCGHGHCSTWYVNSSTGGKGTAVYTPGSEPIAWLYLCGSDRHACLE